MTFARPLLRTAYTSTARARAPAPLAARRVIPSYFSTFAPSLAKKSSKSKKQGHALDHDLDESSATVLTPTKGSKGKKGKSLLVTASGSQPYDSQSEFALGGEGEEEGLDDEEYDDRLVQGKVKPKMTKTMEWAKAVVYEGVERGRGRISPALLDSVRVQIPGDDSLQPLEAAASVTTKQGSLWVEVWDTDYIKPVMSAIQKANLPGISPIKHDSRTLKIPVSRPTQEHRQAILKHINDQVETAKNQFRLARADGMKALKSKNGKNSPAGKEIQKLTDGFGAEVDQLVQDAKRELAKV